MDPWAHLPLGTDGLTARYCELNHLGSFLRQPANAISSLAYAAMAVVVLFRSRDGRVNGSLASVFAASLLLLGFGSAFFHASISLTAQKLDMAGTYAVVLALIAISLVHALGDVRANRPILFGLVLIDVVFHALDFYLYGPWLLPLLLGLTAIGAGFAAVRKPPEGNGRNLAFAFAGLTIGGAAWVIDDRKIGCDPRSWAQFHALWHLATTFGAYQLFRYFDRRPASVEAA